KVSSEKPSSWRRPIRSATIEVMQHGPHLGAALRPAAVVVRHLRQRAVAPFDGRGGPLKRLGMFAGPCFPASPNSGLQCPRERVSLPCRLPRFPCLAPLGFASWATGA